MWHGTIDWVRPVLVCSLAVFTALAGAATAQTTNQNGDGETLIPGIWVDPDGCEHWVMDDGFEGYMSPVVMHDGRPVCGRDPAALPTCGLVSTDTFFATDRAEIPPAGQAHLRKFFRKGKARVFMIEGHTDSRASDAYNLDLSMRRAQAVAAIAKEAGARVEKVMGFGERRPRASNGTRDGMAMNRRVEIICVR